MGNAERRTRGRSQALQLLFTREFDTDGLVSTPDSTADVMDDLVVEDYARELYDGVVEHIDEIDATIESASRNWLISRMPITDRSILRIAVYEILFRDDVPVGVSINEAVELAQSFGGEDDSFKFINGLLGRIAKDMPAPAGDGAQVD
ncbi:MAG: transcription antitermination factor NusB [bacterium]|nr:transcription antitermination factor NusB [bacterium]